MWWEVGCGFVGIALVGYTFQDYLLYYPTIENSRTHFIKPTGNLTTVFEEHFLTTEDNVRLNLWLFRQSTPSRPTLLFFHIYWLWLFLLHYFVFLFPVCYFLSYFLFYSFHFLTLFLLLLFLFQNLSYVY